MNDPSAHASSSTTGATNKKGMIMGMFIAVLVCEIIVQQMTMNMGCLSPIRRSVAFTTTTQPTTTTTAAAVTAAGTDGTYAAIKASILQQQSALLLQQVQDR
jgi:N-methylhydantoinase B/oxoprolinase/acetone carboxylase alpha subunit